MFMISRLRVVAAITGVLVLLVAAPALALHSWNDYHWSSSNLTPKVTGTTSLAIVSDAVDDWAGLDTAIKPETGSGKGDITVVAKRGNPNWIGMAQIKIDPDGHILEGKVTLNSFYANYDNLPDYTNADIWKHVLCQEIGHVLGLAHDDKDTCMNSDADLGQFTTPGVHDEAQLNIIYGPPHDDEPPADEPPADEPPPGGNDPFCDRHPSHRKCQPAGAGQWITLHVFSMPAMTVGR
jgi:hypothetical protein